MNDVDFLPTRYREAATERHNKYWRIVVLVSFAALLGAAAVGQRQIRRGVERELEIVRARHDAAQLEAKRIEMARADLEQLRGRANLIAYLRHPWPRSQILAAVVTRLPASITLTHLTIYRDLSAMDAAAVVQPSTEGSASGATPKKPDAVRDLEKLRKELDTAPLVVKIEGLSTDNAALHAFLSEAPSNLFVKADLGTLERLDEKHPGVAKFNARLVVRAGWGQTGGPVPDLAVTSHVIQGVQP